MSLAASLSILLLPLRSSLSPSIRYNGRYRGVSDSFLSLRWIHQFRCLSIHSQDYVKKIHESISDIHLSPKLSKNDIDSVFNFTSLDESSHNPEKNEFSITASHGKLFIPPGADDSSTSSPLSSRILTGSNIVLSSYAKGAQILQAEFIKSSTNTEQCPSDRLPEFALVGRSNVGKSSLLNSIVKRKQLALTSKKPGKTQCINHFRINDSWYLVDLPGYGYAAAPYEVRSNWCNFTREYFLNRETLVSVFLLIDASIPAKKIDLDYACWLGQNQIPMTVVFTKCDKQKKKRSGSKRVVENIEDFQNLIGKYFEATPPWVMTSSITKHGCDELLLHMSQLRNYWLKH